MNKNLKNAIIAILIAIASYFGYELSISEDTMVKTEQTTTTTVVDTSNTTLDSLK